jgi:hypothetical protein
MTAELSALRADVGAALTEHDGREALRRLDLGLGWPHRPGDPAAWPELFGLLGSTATELGLEELARLTARAASEPEEPVALFEVGWQLIEHGLPDLAASVLARADELAPDSENLVCELVIALENGGHHRDARELLAARPGLLAGSFMCRYLLAFNSVMDGDLATARAVVLDPGDGDEEGDFQFMAGRIERMLARADAVAAVTALDRRDLRGWHFVLTGGLLLHLSPYGFDDGMNGRYAWYQDNEDTCLENLRRAAAVLDALEVRVPQVVALPDRDSLALATAAGRLLDCRVAPISMDRAAEPGLVVGYDLAVADGETLGALSRRGEGQLLLAQASCWTGDLPFAADLTGLLYQANTSPWAGGGLRVAGDGQVERTSADERPPDELAEAVLTAREPELDDLPVLLGLARAAAACPDGALAGAGRRERQWAGSPVPSSRFL